MPERSIGHAWKACVLLSVPRVRIPPHPPARTARGLLLRSVASCSACSSFVRMWRHTPGLMGKILARSLLVLGILASLPILLVCALPIDSIAGDGIDRAGLVGGLLLFLFFSPLASVIYFGCWYVGGAAYRKTVVICVSLVWALPLLGLTLYVAGPELLATSRHFERSSGRQTNSARHLPCPSRLSSPPPVTHPFHGNRIFDGQRTKRIVSPYLSARAGASRDLSAREVRESQRDATPLMYTAALPPR